MQITVTFNSLNELKAFTEICGRHWFLCGSPGRNGRTGTADTSTEDAHSTCRAHSTHSTCRTRSACRTHSTRSTRCAGTDHTSILQAG